MFMSRQARQNAAKAAEGVVAPVVEVMPLPAGVLAEVAARYGVQISGDCRAVAVPRGAAGAVFVPNARKQLVLVRPQLVVSGEVVASGGAIGVEMLRKGMNFRRKGKQGPSAETLVMHGRLRELCAQGCSDADLGAALGLSAEYAGVVRRSLGLAAHAKPTATQVRLADTAFMGRLRDLVGRGVSLTEMARDVGMDRGLLRDLLEVAGLWVALPRKAVVRQAQQQRRAREGFVMDPFKDRILAEYAAGRRMADIARDLGVRRQEVARALTRWQAKAPPSRVMNVAAVMARNAEMIARLEAGADPAVIAQEVGLTVDRVGRVWRAARRKGAGVDYVAQLSPAARVARDATIRAEHAAGIGTRNLMQRHGLTQRQLQRIVRGSGV